MFIDDLNEHEIGMLVVALQHWRARRRDTPTRQLDPVLTDDTVSLLLAKLERHRATSTLEKSSVLSIVPKRSALPRAFRR